MNTTLHRTLTRGGLAVATIVLTAGGLSACGGSSDGGSGGDAPDDVSAADFCGTYSKYIDELTASFTSGGAGEADLVPTLKKYAKDLSTLGTPSDIPDDARKGFELSIDAINDLDDDATQADLTAAGSKFSAEDTADAEAFSAYVQKTCPDLVPSAPSS